MSIWDYADWLEPLPASARVTLGEGHTPLVRSRVLGPTVGLSNLLFKLDYCNPSGSYKDRFAAAAISHMVADGQERCVATSSGNTGSSLAAYCAAAGLGCEIAIVETAPLGKLQQMMSYGARIYRVRGFGLDADITRRAFEHLRKLGLAPGAALQISAFKYCPKGMNGVQTISYELAEECPDGVDDVFCQAGGGGLTLAVARGFELLRSVDRLQHVPKVHCVQPAGNDTMAGPLRRGEPRGVDVQCTSKISGLQVPNVIDGDEVIPACRATGGTGHAVSDDFVWQVQRDLARREGIFCEPAGAVAVAGALQAAAAGELARAANVVCIISGIGFKDTASVEKMVADATCPMLEMDEFEKRSV